MISRILLLLCIVFFIQSDGLKSQIDLSLSKKAKIGSVKLSGALNDFNGNPNTISILFQPQFGTVEIANDGCMYYFPGPGNGEQVLDSFTYQICANNDPTECRQVETRVQIGDGNDFFACEDGYELERFTTYSLDVLANDVNADPSTLNIILSPIAGTISNISVSNGQILLQTNGYQGQTEFLYSVQSAVDGSSDVVKVSLLIGSSNEFVAVSDCRYVVPGTTILEGEAVCYQIDVTNSGGSTATGVTVQDALPSAVSYVASEPAGEYTPGSGNWILADIAPGETETLTITATVNQSGDIENCAQVTAADQNDGDSTPNNNIASEDDQDCATIVGIIAGCTDQCAPNFNPQANLEDGSCEAYSTTCNTDCLQGDIEIWDPNSCSCVVDLPTVLGCTNANACNFLASANCNDGTCIFETACDNDPCTNGGIYAWDDNTCDCELDIATVLGCTDPGACNFVPGPNCNDGSCIFETACDNDPCTNGGTFAWNDTSCGCELDVATIEGCTDPGACNFVPGPNCNDGSCIFETACDNDPCTNGGTFAWDDNTCQCELDIATVLGCTDPGACNFVPGPNCDDDSCIFETACDNDPCTNGGIFAWNDTSCECELDVATIDGCTNPAACNFDAGANCDDDSCIIETACDDDSCTNGGIFAWDDNTCQCELDVATIDGCTNPAANNFDATANCDDGSCEIDVVGCTDPCAPNYNPDANVDSGNCANYDDTCNTDCLLGDIEEWNPTTCSCDFVSTSIEGCTNATATNFDATANCDDGSCIFTTPGCTDPCAPNFEATADTDDGSCQAYDDTCNTDCTLGDLEIWNATTCSCEIDVVTVVGCTNATATNFDAASNCDDGSCIFTTPGCTDPCAPNFEATADTDDGSCQAYDDTCNTDCTLGDLEIWNATTCSCEIDVVTVVGCTSPAACNFDATANCDDGSCTFAPCNPGCTDPCAANYDATADADDGSCDPVDRTCNTDCTLGDIESYNDNTCSCEVILVPVTGCTDPNADNFNAAANCDDDSCIFTPDGLIDYMITQTPDGCYEVSLIPGQDWTGNDGITSTAQITLVIASDGFVLDNLTSVNGIWSNNSTILNPSENPDFEYYTFGLVGLGTTDITYLEGQEEVLFTFCNVGECTSSITLMETGDLFSPPNSEGVNVGNQLTTLGSGNINAWSANQGEIIENCNAVGCTDPCAPNYDVDALEDDGTCEAYDTTCNMDCTLGDITAWNATTCSCEVITVIIQGCTTPAACNYDETANCDDGSCEFAPCNPGCTDPCAPNFDATADEDDGSCTPYDMTCNIDCTLGDIEEWNAATCSCEVTVVTINGCTVPEATNFDATANCEDGSCEFETFGCTDPCASNYDATVDGDDGSCEAYDTTCNTDCTLGDIEEWNAATCSCEVTVVTINGCTVPEATNFDATANCEDDSCEFETFGCTDPCAPNYDATVDGDDGSCLPYDTTCNTDCTLGDIEEWNATTCSCEVTVVTINGCTVPEATNFDATANCEDDSCEFETFGCTDPCAPNYDATVDGDDGSCLPYDTTCNTDCTLGDIEEWNATTCSCEVTAVTVNGCTVPEATNFDATANCEDGSCEFDVLGCTDPCAPNYDATVDGDDGSCLPYDTTCNTDCTLGDIEEWNAATCSCEVVTVTVSGCTFPEACNYNPEATCNDDSCTFAPCDPGCTDPCAANFDPTATSNDGSCEAYDTTCNSDCTIGDITEWNAATCSCEIVEATITGCTLPTACNYNPDANCEDNSCTLAPCNEGCTDPCAPNYDATADADDGSCEVYDNTCNTDCTLGDLEIWNTATCSCEIETPTVSGCNDPDACNYDAAANCDDGSCTFFPCTLGCTDPCAPNYDANAEGDDGSCEAYDITCNTDCTLGDLEEFEEATCSCEVVQLVNAGCTDPDALNFVSIANCDDGSCVFASPGCTNPCSPNFDPAANEDDGSCIDAPCNPGCTDQCAENFDPAAEEDDGTCTPYDNTCNTDCDLGDLEIWDTETCSCILDPISNCDNGNGIGTGIGGESCQNFVAIDAVLCEIGAPDYEVLISISGGSPGPAGYIITDNNTGVVFGPFTSNTLTLGPIDVPNGYSYTVAVTNNTDCFEVLELSAVDCQTTAIEMLRFEGQVETNGNAIAWATATEKDSKMFTVQHSTNGIDFAKVGSVNAIGSSNESNDYNFLHGNVETGTHYYRLSEVDVFGTERIVSDIIALNRNADLQIVRLYPVPTQTLVNLEFVADIEQQIVVKIFDITGRIITEQTTIASKGINQVSIDARSYSAGNYFIQISGNDTNFVERFVKD